MSEWRDVSFIELLIEPVRNGIYKKREFHGRDTKIVNMGELFANPRLYNIKMKRVELNSTEKSKCLLEEGDLLFARRSLTAKGAGKCIIVKEIVEETTFESSIIRARPNQDIASSDFLYYYFNSHYGLYLLGTILRQVAVAGITGSDLMKLILNVPSIDTQRPIASVLSSLDDKIDLLHRQNNTLEAMAETLFRKWFVEAADEGWEEKPLSFYGDIVCGKTPSKKIQSYFNGEIPFIKIPDMHSNIFLFDTTDSLTEEGKLSQSNKTLPPMSICVSCIATVGLVSINVKESQTNQQINSIIPNKEFYRYFLYFTMKAYYDLLHSMASGGTATLNLNTGDFSKIPVQYPGDILLTNFHKETGSLFDKIFLNQSQIRTLEKLRDTFLPKLMSGEVRVKLEQQEADV
jgi:type I restriction enzyme S subunit